jgi:hypothetical protein
MSPANEQAVAYLNVLPAADVGEHQPPPGRSCRAGRAVLLPGADPRWPGGAVLLVLGNLTLLQHN